MPGTVTTSSQFQIIGDSIDRRYPTIPFSITLSSGLGPTPGFITIPPQGIDIDLSAIAEPSWGWVINYDSAEYFNLGIWDGTFFTPIMEFGPKIQIAIPFSRDLKNQLGEDTGTGTIGPDVTLRAKPIGDVSIKASIEIYER